jgi:uncharacterized membrane protein
LNVVLGLFFLDDLEGRPAKCQVVAIPVGSQQAFELGAGHVLTIVVKLGSEQGLFYGYFFTILTSCAPVEREAPNGLGRIWLQ